MAASPPSTTAISKVAPAEQQKPGPMTALWQIVTHVDYSKINAWQALRNTIGVVVPLMVGFAMGMPRGGLAVASGALNVSYSDGSDPYARRAKRMLAATAWWSSAALVGRLTAHKNTVAVIVATLWGFTAGVAGWVGTGTACAGVNRNIVLLV